MNKSMYRVLDWDNDMSDVSFNTLKEAKKVYQKCIKDNPYGNFRLYKDTEKPYRSGNFIEECLLSNSDYAEE